MTKSFRTENLSSLVETWCREAMLEFGSDWEKIAEHLSNRLASLSSDTQERLSHEVILTLSDFSSFQNVPVQ
jgi:hypothetical protein